MRKRLLPLLLLFCFSSHWVFSQEDNGPELDQKKQEFYSASVADSTRLVWVDEIIESYPEGSELHLYYSLEKDLLLATPSNDHLYPVFDSISEYAKQKKYFSVYLYSLALQGIIELRSGGLNSEKEVLLFREISELVKREDLLPKPLVFGNNYLGNRKVREVDYGESLEFFRKGYDIAKRGGIDEWVVKMGSNIISLQENSSDTTGIISLLEEMKEHLSEDSPYMSAIIYNKLGSLKYHYSMEERMRYLHLSMGYFLKSENPLGLIEVHLNFAKNFNILEQYDSTHYYLDLAREYLAEKGSGSQSFTPILVEEFDAQTYYLQGDYKGALKYLDKADSLAKQKGAAILMDDILGLYTDIYKDMGDYETSLRYCIQLMKLKDSIYEQEKEGVYQDLIVKYETERKALEIAKLEEEKVLKDQLLVGEKIRNSILIGSVSVLILLLIVISYSVFLNRKKSRELNELNQIKDRVFSVLSHDLRAPLTTFHSIIEISKRKNLSPEEVSSYLKTLQGEIGNVKMLLESLLRWAQDNQNALEIKSEEINLSTLVDSVVAQMAFPIREKGMLIEVRIPKEVWIRVDGELFGFMVRNLLHNAIKFSPEKEKIEIIWNGEGGSGTLSILDNGHGMTSDQLDALVDGLIEGGIDSQGEKSTGIGLFLCREFGSKMGIELSLESRKSGGLKANLILRES